MKRSPLTFPLALALLALALPVPRAVAESEQARISRVKAAYLLNFARFTEWPASAFEDAKAPIVIVTVGADTLEGSLEAVLENELVGERRLVIQRLQLPAADKGGRPDEKEMRELVNRMRRGHMVYIGASEQGRVRDLLRDVRGSHALTVSDAPDFARAGGMLGLVLHKDRIVFDANPEAIEKSPVRVSSKVLKLARIVKTEGP